MVLNTHRISGKDTRDELTTPIVNNLFIELNASRISLRKFLNVDFELSELPVGQNRNL